MDNLPNSCIEAMALGCVVIGTYGASFEQLIRNKENGLLFQRDSVNAFIMAVDYLMNLPEDERIQMGKKAADSIRRLEPEQVYRNLILFYENTIRNFKRQRKRRGDFNT